LADHIGGYFQRVENSKNVPHTNTYSKEHRMQTFEMHKSNSAQDFTPQKIEGSEMLTGFSAVTESTATGGGSIAPNLHSSKERIRSDPTPRHTQNPADLDNNKKNKKNKKPT